MKSLRKRKLAKMNGMVYYKDYKEDGEWTYTLSVLEAWGSVSSSVRKPYNENFIDELLFLKSLEIENGIVK